MLGSDTQGDHLAAGMLEMRPHPAIIPGNRRGCWERCFSPDQVSTLPNNPK